jgi:hypothetical protein
MNDLDKQQTHIPKFYVMEKSLVKFLTHTGHCHLGGTVDGAVTNRSIHDTENFFDNSGYINRLTIAISFFTLCERPIIFHVTEETVKYMTITNSKKNDGRTRKGINQIH